MLKWNTIQTGSRILLILTQCVILIACVWYIESFYFNHIYPDQYAKDYFLQTDCFVISKRLVTKGRVIKSYRADFWVNYSVDAIPYTEKVSGNGLDISFSRNRLEQQNLLTQFDVGGSYLCWYDKEAPGRVILVMRHNWLSTFPLMVPSAIIVIVLYYLFLNLALVRNEIRRNR
jgi:hypothetical protein